MASNAFGPANYGTEMAGFFFDIRSLFSSRFSGRYLALLLRELARREPTSFASIFAMPRAIETQLVRGELEIETEIRFVGLNGRRRADLALMFGRDAIIYFEIKEDDVSNIKNAAQLKDYVAAIRSRQGLTPKHMFHVSRYLPTLADRNVLKSAKMRGLQVFDIRYRDIHKVLFEASKKRKLDPLGAILLEYLEDIGVASYQRIDLTPNRGGRQMAFLLAQMMGFPHSHNLGKLHSDVAIDGAPELLKTITADVEFLAEWVRKSNLALFRQRFTRKFLPRVKYDLSSLARAIDKLPKLRHMKEGELPGRQGTLVKSGSVAFYALGKLALSTRKSNTSDWLYLEIGFEFSIKRGKKDRANNPAVDSFVYASFYWNGCREGNEPTATKRQIKFPDERKAMLDLEECLSRALAIAMEEAPRKHKQTLARFEIPAASDVLSVV